MLASGTVKLISWLLGCGYFNPAIPTLANVCGASNGQEMGKEKQPACIAANWRRGLVAISAEHRKERERHWDDDQGLD